MAQRRTPATGEGTEDINRSFMDDIAYRRDPDAFKPRLSGHARSCAGDGGGARGEQTAEESVDNWLAIPGPSRISLAMSDDSTPSFDGPQLGETVDGLTLVAVGIRDTFTEVIPSHLEAFTRLNEWMNGIRLYELEDALDIDPNFWDELLDCDYEVGEGEIDGEQPGEMVTIYDVWVDAQQADACLGKLRDRLDELRMMAIELLPPGLHPAARSHATPLETLKLIAQLAD